MQPGRSSPGRPAASGRVFRDRREAGELLAVALHDEPAAGAVVVGLARGGVAVAAEVARRLSLPLDALAVRKVGHPLQPEYAIGAVTAGGGCHLGTRPGLEPDVIETAVAAARSAAAALDRALHRRRPAIGVEGRPCILVDDGIATGETMIAAVQWARLAGSRRVVVAAPVASRESVERLEREADRVVCLDVPAVFAAVGEWFRDFGQLSDAQVLDLLDESAAGRRRLREVEVVAGGVRLCGDLTTVEQASGIVVFAHGSGSSRRGPRNRLVASRLNEAGLATLLLDLLTPDESARRELVFDVPLLAGRLTAAVGTLRGLPEGRLPVGLFGASTGAAAALWAAAEMQAVSAIVSRGGRPDLARPRLALVTAPTLLIVGGADPDVLALNRAALAELQCRRDLVVIPGANHLFGQPGALDRVAEHAGAWFRRYLGRQ